MGGFAFQVACLRLVANEPLFGVYAVPVDWPVLRQNLRVVLVVFRVPFGEPLMFLHSVGHDLEVSPMYTVVQSWHESL